jgi:hypothetical protein
LDHTRTGLDRKRLGPVGRCIRGDDDLELVRGIVERLQVDDPPFDHGFLVVGGDDDGNNRLIGVVTHGAPPNACERRNHGRIPGVSPQESCEAQPEEGLHGEHSGECSHGAEPTCAAQQRRGGGAPLPPGFRRVG